MLSNCDVLVMYAPIEDVDMSTPLVPQLRDAETRACKNKNAMREKYLVWKLLEKAVERRFGLDFANLQFTKTANGQWICPDFYFSLSHTGGAVCVAVSERCVGVDVEKIRGVDERLPPRVLTDGELAYMRALPKQRRDIFFFEAWVKKESTFKLTGGEALMPRHRDTLECTAAVERVRIGNEEYLIGIASDGEIKYEILFLEEI